MAIVITLFLIPAALFISLMAIIGIYGYWPRTLPQADAAVVLGARIIDGNVSPVLAARVQYGVRLLAAGRAERLILTGGKADVWGIAESEAMRRYARRLGAPSDRILTENRSRYTLQNMTETKFLMDQYGLTSCLIVTDPPHLFRAMALARKARLNAFPAPARNSRYRSQRPTLRFLYREAISFLAFY